MKTTKTLARPTKTLLAIAFTCCLVANRGDAQSNLPLTNDVPIVDYGMRGADVSTNALNNTIWGEPKAGMRLGLTEYSAGSNHEIIVQFKSPDESIQSITMTKLYARHGPNFSITLRDSAGNEVKKTGEGRKWKENQHSFQIAYWSGHDVQHLGVLPGGPAQLGYFNIDDCFEWEKAGQYELEVHVTLLKDKGDREHLEPVRFPSLRFALDLPENHAGSTEVMPIVGPMICIIGIAAGVVGIRWLLLSSRRSNKGQAIL